MPNDPSDRLDVAVTADGVFDSQADTAVVDAATTWSTPLDEDAGPFHRRSVRRGFQAVSRVSVWSPRTAAMVPCEDGECLFLDLAIATTGSLQRFRACPMCSSFRGRVASRLTRGRHQGSFPMVSV